MITTFTNLHDIAYWAEILRVYFDMVDVIAIIYSSCYVQYFFNTVSQLFTVEGMALFSSRSMSGLLFEIPDNFVLIMEGQYTFTKGSGVGGILKTVLGYSIV